VAAIGVSAFAMYRASLPHAKHLLQREQEKHLAAISVVSGVYDLELLRRSISKAIMGLEEQYVRTFKRIGHLPFNAPYTNCPGIGSRLPDKHRSASSDGDAVAGHFDTLQPFTEGAARAEGWAYSSTADVFCIALVNPEGIVRGMALTGFLRPDVANALHISDQTTGWRGFVRLYPADGILTAYAQIEQTGNWIPLRHSHEVPEGNWD
jgi:hypothetical protein